ncbi:granulin b isoform X1 [Notolabrus celidotus]|uniref:granulin b isoform X1 n=2 Tax=Notolabrus celidotus TaxID=1203425 RepID=UPI00148FABEF|nr:granulin b isoform X1 [Notolabrus celidotus]XP_034563418.1 granulin b isoform X1 [Notolabrus celidotus]
MMMMMTVRMGILLLALLGLSAALVCPDGGMCEDKNTCCKNTVGGYGCCPLPHAECCSDHLHCCYKGTICDLAHSKCVNKTVSLPWVRRVPAKQAPLIPQLEESVKAVICPDKASECPDDTTCCQLLDGSWGCCPLAKAVCCEDKLHCCPEGTKCDIAHSRCVSASLESFPLLEKIPARRRDNDTALTVTAVTCPGGKSSCPDSYTCCLLSSGDYGCCPYPEAICCSDHLHCCPSSTICDLEHGVCKSGEERFPLLKKIAAVLNDVMCPDKKSACPDEMTCCQTDSGSYGCCPMPDAVCCSDQVHCCPAGTQCDLVHKACLTPQEETTTIVKITAAETELVPIQRMDTSKVGAVPCNDSVACADGFTCCKSSAGTWACCPLPKAVCCEDHMHCCPHGTVCNLEASTCDDSTGSTVMPWLEKVPTFPLLTENSRCDKTTSCPGKATCCKTTGGGWACCPLPQAVCCDDHVHCCPHGTVCNLENQSCDDPFGVSPSLPMAEKVSALKSDVEDEKCDKQTMCPGGTTCCKKDSGQWACCPLPQAVCCSDREHCCPKGYRCNIAEETCDKPGSLSLPWLQKIPALQTENVPAVSGSPRPVRNMCDASTSCPRDTTCCFMDKTKKWGCCPLPNAVCCIDGNHCCPSAHTCEPHRSSCSKGSHVIPWFTKLSALTEPSVVTDVKCDDKSSCASGTTCCKLTTGEWGCCPLVKAVCCDDHEHCCPQGYSCNMHTGTCEKTSNDTLIISTLPQSEVEQPEPEVTEDTDLPCDSMGVYHCPGRDTCCKISSTEWACCPSPKAVCCADSKHCCPAGFSCDMRSKSCTPRSPLTWDSLFGDRKKDLTPHGL